MKYLKGSEIRSMWLEFFKEKGHAIIPSANLIPVNDPSILWINAGVTPLKKYFDGREKPVNPRMTNAQKSIRTNDIENVGKTSRHHTFFEMLGNFSVGDYFREEVIGWAYELLLSPKWFGFDKNLLYITYYTSDLATKERWMREGIAEDHLIPLDDNFWEIGEGPCGPDTEMFIDRGEKYDPNHIGVDLIRKDIENDRYIEIWNIVFSQYDSIPNTPRCDYPELPSKNIDTGCGLERLACVLQETETNYETDLFLPLMHYIEEYTNTTYDGNHMAYRVIMDHIRSVTFAIADGAVFSNEGRGYVLRRILRRAVRYGRKLGIKEAFLYKMVGLVVDIMKDFYPYLITKQPIVEKLILNEEQNFLNTLEKGEKKLTEIMNKSMDSHKISGVDCFLLYDTFGFPLELTIEAAQEQGFSVDEQGFTKCLEEQKKRARSARVSVDTMGIQNPDFLSFKEDTLFVGYDTLTCKGKVIAIFKDGKRVESASDNCYVVLDKTPFYGEMGGQIGDQGTIVYNEESYPVYNTIHLPNNQICQMVDMRKDTIHIFDEVEACVDSEFREHVASNHSATHIVGAALRRVLGNHVVQHGSYVSDKELHFDFNHYETITNEEILEVEKIANEEIQLDIPVTTVETSVEEAKKLGAQALFSEKYGDTVRLVSMDDFSRELCGGTHVTSTGVIKKLIILGLESKGSGIYRITCATSDEAWNQLKETIRNNSHDFDDIKRKIEGICSLGKEIQWKELPPTMTLPKLIGSYKDILNYRVCLDNAKKALKDYEKAYDIAYRETNSKIYTKYLSDIVTKEGYKYLIEKVNGVSVDVVKDILDKISETEPSIFILFATIESPNKVMFVAKSKNTSFNCGNIVKKCAILCNGNGGGRPDFATAGGRDASKVDISLKEVRELLK